MAIISLPYDHTIERFAAGQFRPDHVYKINLYSSFVHNASATTKAQAELNCVQLATANGYIQNDKILTGVVVTQAGANSFFDATDVSWTAGPAQIAATHAMVFNDSLANDPPGWSIDFGGTAAAAAGAPFLIIWNAAGIVTWTKVP